MSGRKTRTSSAQIRCHASALYPRRRNLRGQRRRKRSLTGTSTQRPCWPLKWTEPEAFDGAFAQRPRCPLNWTEPALPRESPNTGSISLRHGPLSPRRWPVSLPEKYPVQARVSVPIGSGSSSAFPPPLSAPRLETARMLALRLPPTPSYCGRERSRPRRLRGCEILGTGRPRMRACARFLARVAGARPGPVPARGAGGRQTGPRVFSIK